jgi:hypothetical protein
MQKREKTSHLWRGATYRFKDNQLSLTDFGAAGLKLNPKTESKRRGPIFIEFWL